MDVKAAERLTQGQLVASLAAKAGWASFKGPLSEDQVADAIRLHALEHVIAGRGADNKPMTFEAAFKAVYGRALTTEKKRG